MKIASLHGWICGHCIFPIIMIHWYWQIMNVMRLLSITTNTIK
jgi:hypothetical protein